MLILEGEDIPSPSLLKKIKCECSVRRLIIILFPTESKMGLVNILARVVEVAFYHLYLIGYDVLNIQKAMGWVPLLHSSKDVLIRGNYAIISKGKVEILTQYWDSKLNSKAISCFSGSER